jgi:ribosome-binding protein aMBF1 (putative translation factor)
MMHSSKQRSVELMKKQSFGTMVAKLRKEKGMTQLDLAEKMGLLIRQYLNGTEMFLSAKDTTTTTHAYKCLC